MCMAMRSIRKPVNVAVTSAVHGLSKTDGRTRSEAMLILGR
jgi:GTP cyclohydrolase I